MKQSVFATTAAAALMVGGAASAQGIALFGDARLGLGYNIDNDGGVLVEDGDTPDDLRAISRVRFGVNMTGETDAGITFGAEIRADNAQGGQGGTEGQTEGSVFVSGSFGTLTYGDTDGADYQWVGDVPGNYSPTAATSARTAARTSPTTRSPARRCATTSTSRASASRCRRTGT
jgi:outer membrane protein OmpU